MVHKGATDPPTQLALTRADSTPENKPSRDEERMSQCICPKSREGGCAATPGR
jgi:hypothetical protein